MQDRIMIAAIQSGSGKTTITCGLLQLLKEQKRKISAFKCGPDYIDPMFHRHVIGVPSHNLDAFFLNEKKIQELFLKEKGEDLSIIEGVMGVYDGLGGIQISCSSYELAQQLDCPIVLVIDAQGMGRTIVPLLKGILTEDTAKLIKGVILNCTSKSFCDMITPVIWEELHLTVFGYVPILPDLSIESRHLGLRMPEEIEELKEKIQHLANCLKESLDIKQLLQTASQVSELTGSAEMEDNQCLYKTRIAIAKDRAFNFYYEENLALLKSFGAQLVPFSPLKDTMLPENIDGLLLGGGYPELFGKELEANRSMRVSIRNAIAKGMPSVAECGGFLYLQQSFTDENGNTYEMVGAAKGNSCYKGRLVRFGYIEVEAQTNAFLPIGAHIRAHEFHYFDSTNNGDACIARKPVTNRSWPCIQVGENYFWGFPHLYYLSNPDFAKAFVQKCASFTKRKSSYIIDKKKLEK